MASVQFCYKYKKDCLDAADPRLKKRFRCSWEPVPLLVLCIRTLWANHEQFPAELFILLAGKDEKFNKRVFRSLKFAWLAEAPNIWNIDELKDLDVSCWSREITIYEEDKK